MDFLLDNFYFDEINMLYENYLCKFMVDDICDEEFELIKDIDIVQDSIDMLHEICDCYESRSIGFKFDDELMFNKLPSPHVYLDNLIKEKIDYNFKGLSNYRVDRSYLNRILKGNSPSKNTLISIGYFLKLDLDEMSELFNVYGYAFGNSVDDRVVFYAFKNELSYDEFLELVDLHGDVGLKKFFKI